MTVPEVGGNVAAQEPVAAANKPKRVRTGCLTCRERHLKCDEGLPHCQNCKKSNRVCKRGLRLNFIDTQVQAPPFVASAAEWKISFLDESRDIASEYQGGLAKYSAREEVVEEEQQQQQQQQQQQPQQHQSHIQSNIDPAMQFDYPATAPQAPSMSYQELPPIQGLLPDSGYSDEGNHMKFEQTRDNHQYNDHSTNHSPFSVQNSVQNTVHHGSVSYSHHEQDLDLEEKREYLNSQDEVLFMQVFVEEVGLWMDSMDPLKHFSRLLPFHSLQEPMLLNAFLACGARHLTLINPIYTEEKALYYYDTATRHLLKNLQNPNRDTVICATTAVILNVYEIMSERALQRMNHIAGARALIKECGWDARATGIGASCFWLNVGLEVLSCLHFNWQVAWDPDSWGIDMDFTREIHNGREEVWTHRMLYIVAKVCNFRATIPRFQEADSRDEDMRRQNRFQEWQRLKTWADAWNENIPRTMHPMAYLYPHQTTSKSAFPEVWLIKRTTIVARLFYHTVMVLMAQIHPYMGADTPEMWDMQKRHAHMICGIAAHVKDRGVASVALRSLAHAAECLTDRREQDEVLQIFTKINKETGWRIAFVFKELKEKWGWQEDPGKPQPHITSNTDPTPRPHTHSSFSASPSSMSFTSMQSGQGQQGFGQQQQAPAPLPPPPPPPAAPAPARRPPSGIVNPMFATADFSMPQHPYQNVYVAPNYATGQSSSLYY